MLFTIKNDNKLPLELLRFKIKRQGTRLILFYKQGAAEQVLDKYLVKYTNLNLKLTCIRLINQISILADKTNEATVYFNNSQLDRLARFITFGTGRIAGSDILKNVFTLKF